MNRVFLAGIALGAAAATAAWGMGPLLRPPGGTGPALYELSYYTPRQPFPDEFGYDLREGDPGFTYPDYDNSYLLSMLSRCRVPAYAISVRSFPDGDEWPPPASRERREASPSPASAGLPTSDRSCR